MASNPLRIFLIGGHGRVALSFTRQAVSSGHAIISQIRNPDHASDITNFKGSGSVQPLVESVEDLDVNRLKGLFEQHKPNVILWTAGAGGKGGEERTRAVFDAIEASGISKSSDFRRFVLLSAIDVRNIETTKPDWYTPEDFEKSAGMRKALPAYMQAKYEADQNLSQRKAFPWTVLRPSTLLNDAGTGQVALAERGRIGISVPRDDVAATLLAISELPKGQADSQMWDLTAGKKDVKSAVENAAQQARSDWVG
ncbi:Predicted dehydrogenase [Ceraceosorus bombacis]|uniref:Predicted dehydrogenase n=1 Tax=Ceraceosorus bombacis TaxID=401625 RepID=A0A0P1BKL4_9BASI|nr:Predicted dehydrogenase [Ceraceosorus bombacis]